MTKKISAKQLAAMKKTGAKTKRQASEVVVQRFDELLARLDKLEQLGNARIKAETELYESLSKLVAMRGEVDLSPLTAVLERIEALSATKPATAYEFTFKHRNDGRYESMHAEPVTPKVTKH